MVLFPCILKLTLLYAAIAPEIFQNLQNSYYIFWQYMFNFDVFFEITELLTLFEK